MLREQSLKLGKEGPGFSSMSPERRIRNRKVTDLGVRHLREERRKKASGMLERLEY